MALRAPHQVTRAHLGTLPVELGGVMNSRSLPLVTALLISAALLTATACGDRKDIEMVGDDPRVFVQTSKLQAYPDMSHGGTLEYSPADKCLYFRTGQGRVAVVWPPGTRPVLEDGVRGVDVPGVGVILEGVAVGTGGIQLTYGDDEDPWAAQVNDLEIVTECLPQGARIIVMSSVKIG
jgi:hypothetical protein